MDTYSLIATERRRLADELGALSDADWRQPSRCAGWTTHVVAAHLNLPWRVSSRHFLLSVIRQRGNLDRAMDVESRRMATLMAPAECVTELRANAEDRFAAPTMPPEAPMTDVIVHGADILRPLGREVAVSADALRAMLGFLVTKRATRGFRSVGLDGLRLEATDVDWSWDSPGATATVSGPALALASTLVGRHDHTAELSGDGAGRLTTG